MEENKVILRTYSNIWKVERILEHLNGIRVNSIPIEHAAYVLGVGALEVFLLVVIPPFRHINWLLLIAFPFGIGSFLKKVKLDGKNAIKYLYGLAEYLFEPKRFLRFKEVQPVTEAYFDEMIACRRVVVVKESESLY